MNNVFEIYAKLAKMRKIRNEDDQKQAKIRIQSWNMNILRKKYAKLLKMKKNQK